MDIVERSKGEEKSCARCRGQVRTRPHTAKACVAGCRIYMESPDTARLLQWLWTHDVTSSPIPSTYSFLLWLLEQPSRTVEWQVTLLLLRLPLELSNEQHS